MSNQDPMKILHVNVINESNNELPKYESIQAAGMDARANLQGIHIKQLYNAYRSGDDVVLCPGGRVLIPTGIHVKLLPGYELQVRPRSGLALKNGITVLNTPGTVDADYRGDIGVILINHGTENFTIHHGDRIAQFVVTEVKHVGWIPVDSFDDEFIDRNSEGFGTTGVK